MEGKVISIQGRGKKISKINFYQERKITAKIKLKAFLRQRKNKLWSKIVLNFHK